MCSVYLSVVMQLSRFDCWMTKEQPRDQEVVPGAQQLLMLQQSFFIASQDLQWRECTWECLESRSLSGPETKTVTDLADDFQVFVAGKGAILEAVIHLLVPEAPLHMKICQCLCATRLKRQQNIRMSKPPFVLQSASRFMQMLPLCYTNIITGLYTISKLSYLGFFIQNKDSTFWTNQQIQLQKQILSAAKMDK